MSQDDTGEQTPMEKLKEIEDTAGVETGTKTTGPGVTEQVSSDLEENPNAPLSRRPEP